MLFILTSLYVQIGFKFIFAELSHGLYIGSRWYSMTVNETKHYNHYTDLGLLNSSKEIYFVFE